MASAVFGLRTAGSVDGTRSNAPSSVDCLQLGALARIAWHQEIEGDAHRFGLVFSDGSVSEITAWGHGGPSGGLQQEDGLAVLFPTQIGCAMRCSFCAVGQHKLKRSLGAEEMLAAIEGIERALGRRATGIQAAGHGEPLLNYREVLRCCHVFKASHPGAAIDIHTCGIFEGIEALSREDVSIGLSVTLHSAVQATRDRLMPAMTVYPLAGLEELLVSYPADRPGPTLIVSLVDGTNDGDGELEALVSFAERTGCRVSLSLMGKTWGRSPFSPAMPERLSRFYSVLMAHAVPVSCAPRTRRRTVLMERYVS